MSAAPPSSYGDLPYESRFNPRAHPDRLATMAVLHGLTPPPVEHCRVLELGCADGGNLLPTAETLPGARFLGIDRAPNQIDAGREAVARIGLANVELRALSILDVDESLGRFDYIICHGVYSWVPAEVRDHILTVCARNLAPNGVAYVSYNTFPGWHLRGMIRDMLLDYTRRFDDARTRVQQARAFLDFLARAASPPDGVYAQVLRHEAELFKNVRDTYIFHDHLEEVNHPVYVREFLQSAGGAGLQYLAPARFDINDVNLAPEVKEALSQLGTDRAEREQYLDYIHNRTFRQTLLCHAGLDVRPSPAPEALAALQIVALARPESPLSDVRSGAPVAFLSLFGDRLTVGSPSLKAALVALCERWPRSATLDELWAEVAARLGRGFGDRPSFARTLLDAHLANLVEFTTYEPRFALEPGERPRAARKARVHNLRLCAAALDDLDALLLPLLDGTRDRPALVEALARSVFDGTFQIHEHGRPVDDPARVRAALAEALGPRLQQFASQALLIRA